MMDYMHEYTKHVLQQIDIFSFLLKLKWAQLFIISNYLGYEGLHRINSLVNYQQLKTVDGLQNMKTADAEVALILITRL